MCASVRSPAKRTATKLTGLSTVLLSMITFAGGCAKNLHVKYISDPPGAWIFSTSGYKYGQCPFTIIYDVTKEDKEKGYVDTPALQLLWIDCQKLRLNSTKFDIRESYSWRQTISIPRESSIASGYGRLYSSYRRAVDIRRAANERMQFKVNYNQASFMDSGRAGYMNWGSDLAESLSAGRTARALKSQLQAFEAQHGAGCVDWPTP